MKPIEVFKNQDAAFWASVRSLSQKIGYSRKDTIIAASPVLMAKAANELGLNPDTYYCEGKATELGVTLEAYFEARQTHLHSIAEPNLMDADDAKLLFNEIRKKYNPSCPLPMNKQKGNKRAEAFLTGLVNIMIEAHANDHECDYDPRELTTFTKDGKPVRTFARRLDGAFPGPVNPIAVWEIKEYYYTTTFGSRIADGVYETLLDGMEVEELREHTGIDVKHYLMVDAYFTWWKCGKSYLCRMFDMLHMGVVDEILFGREVVSEMPRIVSEWIAQKKTI